MRGDPDQSDSDRPRPGDSGNGAPQESREPPGSVDATDPPERDERPGHHVHPHLPHGHLPHLPHPQLIEPEEDRWKWRAKIRRDPRQLFFYRIGVGVAGLLLMIAAAITGPLPGPGGIPLFLLGLAVWSSEFEWANNVMGWFRRQFDRYRRWPRHRRVGFWVVVILVAWAFFYLGMLLYGVPIWFPEPLQEWLRHLPGVH